MVSLLPLYQISLSCLIEGFILLLALGSIFLKHVSRYKQYFIEEFSVVFLKQDTIVILLSFTEFPEKVRLQSSNEGIFDEFLGSENVRRSSALTIPMELKSHEFNRNVNSGFNSRPFGRLFFSVSSALLIPHPIHLVKYCRIFNFTSQVIEVRRFQIGAALEGCDRLSIDLGTFDVLNQINNRRLIDKLINLSRSLSGVRYCCGFASGSGLSLGLDLYLWLDICFDTLSTAVAIARDETKVVVTPTSPRSLSICDGNLLNDVSLA